MASYLDFLMSSGIGRVGTPAHANVGVNTPPATSGIGQLASIITQKKMAKDSQALQREQLAEQQRQFDIGTKLDIRKMDQVQRQSFLNALNNDRVQSDLASGDPSRVESAMAIIRAAGGQVDSGPPPMSAEGIGQPATSWQEPGLPTPQSVYASDEAWSAPAEEPTTQPMDAQREDQQAPAADAGVMAQYPELAGLQDIGSLAALRGEEPKQQVTTPEPMPANADESVPVTSDGVTFTPAGTSRGMDDGYATPGAAALAGESLGTTSGALPKVPMQPGMRQGPQVVGVTRSPDAPDAPTGQPRIVDPEPIGSMEKDGEEVPIHVETQSIEPTTVRRVFGPGGEFLGTINIGGSDEIVNKAMKSIEPYVQAWSSTLVDAPPLDKLLQMARARVKSTLSGFKGTLEDGIKAAEADINNVFETLHKNQRAAQMAESKQLGMIDVNDPSQQNTALRFLQSTADDLGFTKLYSGNRAVGEAIRQLETMAKNPTGADSIAFWGIVYDIAKLRDSGKLSDQDVKMVMGSLSLSERVQSWVAENIGLTKDDFTKKLDAEKVFGAGTIPQIRVKRFLNHMYKQSLLISERLDKARAWGTEQYRGYLDRGNYAAANTAAAFSNSNYGTNLQFIPAQEALERFQKLQLGIRTQNRVNAQNPTGNALDDALNSLQQDLMQ